MDAVACSQALWNVAAQRKAHLDPSLIHQVILVSTLTAAGADGWTIVTPYGCVAVTTMVDGIPSQDTVSVSVMDRTGSGLSFSATSHQTKLFPAASDFATRLTPVLEAVLSSAEGYIVAFAKLRQA
jgi:hypothetical protein